jgi:hypothetical protein
MYELYGTALQMKIEQHLEKIKEWQTVSQVCEAIQTEICINSTEQKQFRRRVRLRLNALAGIGRVDKKATSNSENLLVNQYKYLSDDRKDG